jgi:hypothetical protein
MSTGSCRCQELRISTRSSSCTVFDVIRAGRLQLMVEEDPPSHWALENLVLIYTNT